MHFHKSLILNNVLFVPSFELNLIFVAKLNQTFSCHANFTNNQENLPKEKLDTIYKENIKEEQYGKGKTQPSAKD